MEQIENEKHETEKEHAEIHEDAVSKTAIETINEKQNRVGDISGEHEHIDYVV
jgi:hypothetical protein